MKKTTFQHNNKGSYETENTHTKEHILRYFLKCFGVFCLISVWFWDVVFLPLRFAPQGHSIQSLWLTYCTRHHYIYNRKASVSKQHVAAVAARDGAALNYFITWISLRHQMSSWGIMGWLMREERRKSKFS